MSAEGRLLAVQLANQRLTESLQKMQDELERVRAENREFAQRNARLQERLAGAERLCDTLKAEYKQATGKEYAGRRQITMFGFQKSA